MTDDTPSAPRLPKKSTIAVLGIAIGMLSAFLGIGGGVLVVPLLIVGFRVDPRVATGTSLGVVAFVVGTSVVVELLNVFFGSRPVQPAWLAAVLIAPTSMFAASFAAPLVRKIPQAYLRAGFAVVLWIAAYKLSGIGASAGGGEGWFEYATLSGAALLLLPLLGLIVGTISALVGIGGGMVLIPALALLFSDMNALASRSTSLLIVLPTAIMGYLRHRAQGTAVQSIVRTLAPTCAAGAVLGSLLVHYVAADWFPKAFAVFMFLAGLRLIMQKKARASAAAPGDSDSQA
ncbi:MAG: sulfite exporter TauE/SafE family protein [Planctomycetes bacterium]|nr:sulfite exporter TauE/SafE family protein [Planctomycetota bacterium]